MVLYDDDANNDDQFDGLPEYDYYCPNTNPGFGSYKSSMSMAYSNCDVNKLVYNACKHKEKTFNNDIIAISTNLNHAFDITRPCALCGKSGHIFDTCEELQDQVAIQKSYIQLSVALQKFKVMTASQGRDVNSL